MQKSRSSKSHRSGRSGRSRHHSSRGGRSKRRPPQLEEEEFSPSPERRNRGGDDEQDLQYSEENIMEAIERGLSTTNNGDIQATSINSPASTTNGVDDDYFVTSPPKRDGSGLTSNISSLFRRVASNDQEDDDDDDDGDNKDNEEEDEDDDEDEDGSGGGDEDPQEKPTEYEQDVTNADEGDNAIDKKSDKKTKDKSSSKKKCSKSSPKNRKDDQAEQQDEDDADPLPTRKQVGRGRPRTRSSKRIYQSFTDGTGSDSDDSYDSRRGGSDVISPSTTNGSEYMESDIEDDRDNEGNGLKRYRGFSTSIASLFLDESLVCTSIGCFGLILSNRTEYLLQVRDHIRGVKQSKKNQTADKRSPSKVFSYLLLLTIVLIFMTFVIWGFGNGNALTEDNNGGLYSNNNNNNDDGVDDYYNANQDDQVQSNDKQDDGYYQDYYEDDGAVAANDDNAGNDDAQANNNDDGGNNKQNNDDGNYAANDDGGGYNYNYNNYMNYNYNNYNYNNDDGGNNQNNDDGANVDDGYANDDGDDYYAADDDDNGRKLQRLSNPTTNKREGEGDEDSVYHHHATGIFKLRDCQEHVWDPVADFAQKQWNREATAGRSLAETYTDDFDEGYDSPERDLATDIRTALFLTFLLFLGVLGRRRRMRTRFQLVRARAQDDRLYQIANSGKSRHLSMKDELEDKAYEVACSHTILGCYPIDPPEDEEEETKSRKRAKKHEDFVSRGFKCLMASCCGFCCKCWFQCLSVCALAQEAREMRVLLPPRYQRIDYITHQPFSEYQKDVNELRRGWLGHKRRKGGLIPHYNALSRLSRYILSIALLTFLVIIGTLIFNPRAAFSWPDAVLLIATFVQSFLVLYIVHWLFHRSDLSLDAVIKFFAAGFVIAVPSAVFFEGIQVNIILMSAWTVYEFAHSMIGDGFANWVASNYRLIWILGELFNAYVVAAVTEELCKYYTFRSVEHPDLIFLTGLDRKSHDEHAADGGLTAYPFGAHNVSDLNRNKSWDSQRSDEEKLNRALHSTNTAEEFYEDEHDVRTYRQKAAAVTTGMISVAVGLACAENMMYVFLLGGARGSSTAEHRGDVYEEWIVLLFRSVFPIHALAAALQSINMVRKFVEGSLHNNHRIGVGRVILPAVILHGTFDAILMGINVYVESAWDSYLEENEGRVGEGEPYNPRHVNFAAWFCICMVTFIGCVWYIGEHNSQQSRLKVLDDREKSTQASSYRGPNATSTPKSERSSSRRSRRGQSTPR